MISSRGKSLLRPALRRSRTDVFVPMVSRICVLLAHGSYHPTDLASCVPQFVIGNVGTSSLLHVTKITILFSHFNDCFSALLFVQAGQCSRPMSTTVPVVKTASSGAGLFQRLSSFLVGAGLTALVTQFFILDEVRKGNGLMVAKQAELESRLAKLEKK